MQIEPGVVIGERYQLERLLGEGGMGAVWAAVHLVTRKHVALKFLKAAPENKGALRRFLREARAAAAIRHPNVLQVHDVLQHESMPVMVLDLLHGESLAARLARQGSIPLGELAHLMLPVVSALGTAHELGIVHRDIKPDNIFLEQTGDGQLVPKVLDFGIAKLTHVEGEAAATSNLTSTGAVMGTPYYMAPEQVFGEKDIDHRADVWAVGILLYECLTGKKPVDGENVGQLFKQIVTGSVEPLDRVAPYLPQDVTQTISRLLISDRSLRAPDLRELYATLGRYASVEAASFGSARWTPSTSTDPNVRSSDGFAHPSTDTEIVLPTRKPPWGWLAGGLAVLAAAGVALAFARPLAHEPTEAAEPSAAPEQAPPLPTPPSAAPIVAPEPNVSPAASTPDADSPKQPVPRNPKTALAPKPKPSASSPSPQPSANPVPTRKPGNVVEAVPF